MSESKFLEKCLEENLVYDGRIIKVFNDTVSLPNGKTAYREVVRHPGAVGIVAIKDQNILMVNQYRYPLGKETLEIPAGKIDPGEDPQKCAARELREETGYDGDLDYLGVFNTSPGFADETIYLYLAKNLVWSPLKADEDEFLGVIKIPCKEAVEMAYQGQITDAKTLIGILLMARVSQ